MGRWRKFIDDQFAHDDLFERVGCFLGGAPLAAISGFFLFEIFQDIRQFLDSPVLFAIGLILSSFLFGCGLLLAGRAFAPIDSALTRLARKVMSGLGAANEWWIIPVALAGGLASGLLTLLLRKLGISGQRDASSPPP
ncbi:MAG: hypothetical protein QM651_18865 [Rhodoblastus sp.]